MAKVIDLADEVLPDNSTTVIEGIGDPVFIGISLANFEKSIRGLVGREVPVVDGFGFSPLSVVAVPEPSMWATIAGSCVI